MHFPTAFLLTLIPSVLSHGLITSPPSRPVGPAIIANCGPKVEVSFLGTKWVYCLKL